MKKLLAAVGWTIDTVIRLTTISLGKPFGIQTTLSSAFVILCFFLLGMDWKFGLVYSTVILLFILPHEFGHALTAQKLGWEVKSIIIIPIGGIASIAFRPDDARKEFLVTFMGPMVNVILAILLTSFAALLTYIIGEESTVAGFLRLLAWINLLIVLFNMIPAFPMDGGRLFRSMMAFFTEDYCLRTKVAVRLGYVCCFGMALYGIYNMQPLLVVIAPLIALSGTAELFAVYDYRDRKWVKQMLTSIKDGCGHEQISSLADNIRNEQLRRRIKYAHGILYHNKDLAGELSAAIETNNHANFKKCIDEVELKYLEKCSQVLDKICHEFDNEKIDFAKLLELVGELPNFEFRECLGRMLLDQEGVEFLKETAFKQLSKVVHQSCEHDRVGNKF